MKVEVNNNTVEPNENDWCFVSVGTKGVDLEFIGQYRQKGFKYLNYFYKLSEVRSWYKIPIENFEKQLRVLQPRKCVCCEKEITPLASSKCDPANAMWHDGVVDRIGAGYGSKFDGDVFLIAICDDCISKKLETNIISINGNLF